MEIKLQTVTYVQLVSLLSGLYYESKSDRSLGVFAADFLNTIVHAKPVSLCLYK